MPFGEFITSQITFFEDDFDSVGRDSQWDKDSSEPRVYEVPKCTQSPGRPCKSELDILLLCNRLYLLLGNIRTIQHMTIDVSRKSL